MQNGRMRLAHQQHVRWIEGGRPPRQKASMPPSHGFRQPVQKPHGQGSQQRLEQSIDHSRMRKLQR